MRNEKKGCYLRIYKAPSEEERVYCIEMGNEFEAFRIAVNFADLITIKNEITEIEERNKANEEQRLG